MAIDTQTHLGLSQELLDAIQAFPVTSVLTQKFGS